MSSGTVVNFQVFLVILTKLCNGIAEPVCETENAESNFINHAKNVSKL